MKYIIAGSRSLKDRELILRTITDIVKNNSLSITQIVSGGANGIDHFGEEWATIHHYPIKLFPAKWKDLTLRPCSIRNGMYGPHNALAGHNRNREMAAYADGLILIWDGKSSGSKNMKELAVERGLTIYEKIL